MDLSVFTTVLESVREYLKERTRIALYVPIVAFLGAWLLVYIAAFGFEAPLAFWLQLSAELRVVLIAALVFTVLFLAYLTSHLSILITRLYQGRWPQWLEPITHRRRMVHLKKWRVLNQRWRELWKLYDQIEILRKTHWPDLAERIVPVPKCALPAWHLIRPRDLKFKELSHEEAKGRIQDASKLIGCYTLEALGDGKPISQKQIRAQPWPGYLDGKSVISVPVAPHAIAGTKANVQLGSLIDIVLTPRRWAFGKTETFHNVLVFDMKSVQEVVAGSDGSITRELVVLVVTLDTDEHPRFVDLLATHDVSIRRPMAQIDALATWLEGRVPRQFSLTTLGVSYSLPPDGVWSGSVIDIEGMLDANGDPIKLGYCFVYEATAKELKIAIPEEKKDAYDDGHQDEGVTITHAVEPVPVLRREVAEGAILVKSDFDTREVRVAELPADFVKDKDLINHRVLTTLPAGSYVFKNQVEEVAELKDRVCRILSLAERDVNYQLPDDGVSAGDVIDIKIMLDKNQRPIEFLGCFVYGVTKDSKGWRVAIPKEWRAAIREDQAATYDGGSQSATVTVAHSEYSEVPFLMRHVPAGKFVAEENIETKSVKVKDLPDNVVTSKKMLLKCRAKENIAARTYVLKNQVKEVKILENREARDFPPAGLQNFKWHWPRYEVWPGKKVNFIVSPGEVVDIVVKTADKRRVTFESCFVYDVTANPLKLEAAVSTSHLSDYGKIRGKEAEFTIEHIDVWKDLLRLERQFEDLRVSWLKFMTTLFSDRWPEEEEWDLLPLQQFASDMRKLDQDLTRFDDQWPGTVTELKTRWRDLNQQGLQQNLVNDLKRAVDTRRDLLEKQINLYFPYGYDEEVMPTRLGNILKAVERYPYRNYGIEADILWPRLKDELREETTQALAGRKDRLDMLLLMSFLSLIFWPLASAVLALYSDKWLAFVMCSIGAPSLAWLCHRAAIQAALEYGENLKSIYDLHRWELLKKFNFELPSTLTLREEKDWWSKVNELLIGRARDTDKSWGKTGYRITSE